MRASFTATLITLQTFSIDMHDTNNNIYILLCTPQKKESHTSLRLSSVLTKKRKYHFLWHKNKQRKRLLLCAEQKK